MSVRRNSLGWWTLGSASGYEVSAFLTKMRATSLKHIVYLPEGRWRVPTGEIIPSNVTLRVEPGATIDVVSGDLVVNGPVNLPLSQVFTDSSSVKFGANVQEVYPEWWYNGTGQHHTAIQRADNSLNDKSGIVRFMSSTYDIGATVNKNLYSTWRGVPTIWWAGKTGTAFNGQYNGKLISIDPAQDSLWAGSNIEGVSIWGNKATYPNVQGLYLARLRSLTLRDMFIDDCAIGIFADGSQSESYGTGEYHFYGVNCSGNNVVGVKFIKVFDCDYVMSWFAGSTYGIWFLSDAPNTGCNGHIFQECVVQSSGVTNFLIDDCENIFWHGGRIENCTGAGCPGAHIKDSVDIGIYNALIANNGNTTTSGQGVLVEASDGAYCERIKLMGNTFKDVDPGGAGERQNRTVKFNKNSTGVIRDIRVSENSLRDMPTKGAPSYSTIENADHVTDTLVVKDNEGQYLVYSIANTDCSPVVGQDGPIFVFTYGQDLTADRSFNLPGASTGKYDGIRYKITRDDVSGTGYNFAVLIKTGSTTMVKLWPGMSCEVEMMGAAWRVTWVGYNKDTYHTRTLVASDATPCVGGKTQVTTANAEATTITALDGGELGQRVQVVFGDAVTTIDFSGTSLLGNQGVDWTPAAGDWMDCVFDGTNWHCHIVDNTA